MVFKRSFGKRSLLTSLLPIAILALSGAVEAQSEKSMGSLRPAARAESPEEKRDKERNPPQMAAKRQAKEEKLNSCKKQPDCRAKLDAAMKKPADRKPLPAATSESPEEIELKKHAPPEPAGPGLQKRSSLSPTLDEIGSFLSRLNPIPTAMAQGTVSAFVTPAAPRGDSGMSLSGTAVSTSSTNGWHFISSAYSSNVVACDGGSCERIYVYIPTTGDYIINFRAYAYGGGAARLRHQYNGPIIEEWDFAGAGCGTCNFATVEYLAQGTHYFYLIPNDYLYVYSASVETL